MKKQTIIWILTSGIGILCITLVVCVAMLIETSHKLNYHRNRYHEFVQLHRILADMGYHQDGLDAFEKYVRQTSTEAGTYFVISPLILWERTSPYALSSERQGYKKGATDFYGYFLMCDDAGYVIGSGLDKP